MELGTKVGLAIITIGLLYNSPVIYDFFQNRSIEKSMWLWTKGTIYCKVCKSNESIAQILVGNSFGDKNSLRFIHILTDPHRSDGKGSFEALATVDGTTIKNVRIGCHPGCGYDCFECARYGWNE
jgi:hypothetical protein